ncbi:putative phosphonate catabolism associated alcohol dehydrogenase [Promicromonospora umidemergens]|nr:putative phosphonate catabolism associated alcohol dehydrogenase [Promicromonospora umidemergens]
MALWEGGDAVRLVEVPLPEPGPGEVLVRIRLATVCGSDRHTVSGRRAAPVPSVLGHEAVGDVVATGSGGATATAGAADADADADAADGRPLAEGDRVVWGVTVACGACDRCTAGRTAKCRSVRKVGHEGFASAWPLSGTYAQHILLPRGATIAHVPDALPDELASPAGCATATVMATLEAAGPLTGRRVLISGAGMLGITAVAAARAAGAAQVLVTDPDRARLDLAVRFGATSTHGVETHGVETHGVDVPGPVSDGTAALGPVDVAIELSGASSAVARCLDALDVGGRLVLAGSVAPAPSVPLDAERVVRGWLTITGVHNYEPRHLRAALELLARTCDTVPWHELVTPAVGLSQVGRLLTGPAGVAPRAAVVP